MRIVTSIAAMQRLALKWKGEHILIGFVPTMGYLHAGHLSLVKKARQKVGVRGKVVVSIYVNPTQFAPTEDLAKYPRDLERDQRLCEESGVDILFVPADSEMYPHGDGAAEGFSTYVVEENLTKVMEGASRSTHFRGVTTVVAKLFHLVLPDVAVFGAKDFQQAAVIQRMVVDLSFPVNVAVAPTVREPDGLAMSSRNKFLSTDERQQATVLWRAIELARRLVAESEAPLPATALKAELGKFIALQPAARVDYVELFDPVTLRPAVSATQGTHLALAVHVGSTRLIDNGRL